MKTYWLAARPYSLTASVVPVLLGAGLAKLLLPSLALDRTFWLDFALVMLGCLAVQCVSNVVNDLVDFKTGLDTAESSTRFKALVTGALTWRQMLSFALLLSLISGAIGLYFAWLIRGPVIWLILAGGTLALEYTAPPLKLKYRALGDLAVLLCFGLGMLFGTYFVLGHAQAECLAPRNLVAVLVYALPSASLVVAILHANNHRDRAADRDAGAQTLANTLSFDASKTLLYGLLVGPYAFAAAASILGVLEFGPLSLCGLAVFLPLPPLLNLLRPVKVDSYETTVPSVAKLHGQFGLVLTLVIVAQILLSHGSAPGA